MKKSTMSVVEFPAVQTSKQDMVILWTLAVLGSQEALTKFLYGAAWIVRRWMGKMAGVKNQDALQETLIAIWQSIATFDPSKGAMSTWLCQMTRKGWLYATRKNGNETLFSLLDGSDEEFIEQIPSLDKEVQLKEEMEEVCSLLDEERQNILAWYFLEGNTFAEVAEKLGCSVPTARNRVLGIVNLCREHFGVKGKVEGLTKNGMTVVH